MSKKVLITAGAIGAPIDDNKYVTNRARGVWATRFAEFLAKRGCEVTLLMSAETPQVPSINTDIQRLIVDGYAQYRHQCYKLATSMDAFVSAAAVTNWLPTAAISGKMPTDGYKEGDTVQVPFTLVPRVINAMRGLNPNLTIIGCKLTIGATYNETVKRAYGVLLNAKCNVVVANDKYSLRQKDLVYPDGAHFSYDVRNKPDAFFEALEAVIHDVHYHTDHTILNARSIAPALLDKIIDKYRSRFMPNGADGRVYGAVYIRIAHGAGFASPREKGKLFTSQDCVLVDDVNWDKRIVKVTGASKATLNAPLLQWVADMYPLATAVLHLHEQLPDVPTLPYAPPGTIRDNHRDIPGPVFNIEGHGFIACLDANLEIWKTKG